ncbi:DUF3817 domain-containing protein [Microbacterium sp. P04]|uniref:DUF3817 domain-containing protein n=1 Tax=Microbacterium sp. P04 TaxID=3366947 RepID=UPI0037469C25
MFRTPMSLFRTLAIAEMISWTLLIVGLIARALSDVSLAVTVGGSIHGFVFLAYGATALVVALNQRWGLGTASVAIGSAIVPYATLPVERWLQRTGRLGGEWRVRASDDPRDQRPVDRALRFLLARPGVLAAVVIAAVAAVFVVLLVIGPPGGRG